MQIKQQLIADYLDYVNNYLSVEKFAEHREITQDQALQIIQLGKTMHEQTVVQQIDEDEDTELAALIKEYCEQEDFQSFEGPRGVEQLNSIALAINYTVVPSVSRVRTPCRSLLHLLADNSALCEKIVEWIGQQDIPEWKENIESNLFEKDEDEEEEDL